MTERYTVFAMIRAEARDQLFNRIKYEPKPNHLLLSCGASSPYHIPVSNHPS